jgi:hypothetical protein
MFWSILHKNNETPCDLVFNYMVVGAGGRAWAIAPSNIRLANNKNIEF